MSKSHKKESQKMKNEKSFPELLAYYRSKAGLSQKELAKLSGLSAVQIARYETNKSKPRLKAVFKLAKALNIEISKLGFYRLSTEETPYPVGIDEDIYEIILSIANKENKKPEQVYIGIVDNLLQLLSESEELKEYLESKKGGLEISLKATSINKKNTS